MDDNSLGPVLLWTAVGTIIIGLFFGGWSYVARYIDTNMDRVIFKQSITYNEGVLDDLAKYMYEYNNAEDETAQEAIKTLVRNRFANYDKSKIENDTLREFMEVCGL